MSLSPSMIILFGVGIIFLLGCGIAIFVILMFINNQSLKPPPSNNETTENIEDNTNPLNPQNTVSITSRTNWTQPNGIIVFNPYKYRFNTTYFNVNIDSTDGPIITYNGNNGKIKCEFYLSVTNSNDYIKLHYQMKKPNEDWVDIYSLSSKNSIKYSNDGDPTLNVPKGTQFRLYHSGSTIYYLYAGNYWNLTDDQN